MAAARVRVAEGLKNLTRTELEQVIHEAALGTENTRIAEMYLLDWTPQVEIGGEIGLTRSAVSRRLPKIMDKIERTARKLGLY